MASARKYYTDVQLVEDARHHRDVEMEFRLRARTEWNASLSLRLANAAKMKAEASETILRQRKLNEEQVSKSGAAV